MWVARVVIIIMSTKAHHQIVMPVTQTRISIRAVMGPIVLPAITLRAGYRLISITPNQVSL